MKIKKLSCEECESNDLEFKIFVDEFGEPTSDIQKQIKKIDEDSDTIEAWCKECEMWQGVVKK